MGLDWVELGWNGMGWVELRWGVMGWAVLGCGLLIVNTIPYRVVP